ncbi:hypothetical protein QBC45DRAFT_470501 [Copromyces sp. CBS 386.78]|nr:hypothetical protein QBC45DRAFT_470501 [Copromyces sp. CBS 386.78]
MPPVLHSLFPRQAERPSFSPDTLAGYDLSDKSTQKPTIRQVNLVLIVLVGVVVSLRIVCRGYITRRLFVDDYLIILAGLFTLVSASMALAATRYGLGEHIWNLPLPVDNMLEMLTRCVKHMYVAHVFYSAAGAFTKLSILTSYLRIFSGKVLRWILCGTAAVVSTMGVCAVFATIFQCTPVKAAWDYTIADSKCFSFVDFLYANAGINMAIDFVLVAAPLPYFWSLSIPLRQRLMICVLFGVGFIGFAASIVRIVSLSDVKGIDVTYYLVSPLNWTIIECSLGIICVSVPPMRPLLAKLAPPCFSSYLSEGDEASKVYPGSQQRTQHGEDHRVMGMQLDEIDMAARREREMQSSTGELLASVDGPGTPKSAQRCSV